MNDKIEYLIEDLHDVLNNEQESEMLYGLVMVNKKSVEEGREYITIHDTIGDMFTYEEINKFLEILMYIRNKNKQPR